MKKIEEFLTLSRRLRECEKVFYFLAVITNIWGLNWQPSVPFGITHGITLPRQYIKNYFLFLILTPHPYGNSWRQPQRSETEPNYIRGNFFTQPLYRKKSDAFLKRIL